MPVIVKLPLLLSTVLARLPIISPLLSSFLVDVPVYCFVLVIASSLLVLGCFLQFSYVVF